MTTAIVRRLLQAGLTLLVGIVIVFLMLALTPGNPAARVLAARGLQHPSAAQIEATSSSLHLEDPLPVRFWHYLVGVLHGDLGVSWTTGRPVTHELGGRLPATLILTTAAMAIAIVLSLGLGLLSAARPGKLPDHLSRAISLFFLVMPSFLFGVVVLDLVVVDLGLGRVISDGTWGTVFLPAFTLAMGSVAAWSRILRAGLLDARAAPYLQVSTARGASPSRRLLVHQLPNALPAYLTLIGVGAAALLGGAPIVESVFTWPGIGRYTVQAVEARDMPVVVGFTLLAILLYVIASLLVDLANTLIDPRLRTARGRRRPGAEAAT